MKKPEAIGYILNVFEGKVEPDGDADPESWGKHAAGIDSMIAGFDAGLLREAGGRLSHFDQEQVTLRSLRVANIPQSDSKSGGCLCRSDFSPSASVPAPTRNYLPLPPAS